MTAIDNYEDGLITQVRLVTFGATIRSDLAAGVQTIPVSDAAHFNAEGGKVAITSYPGGSLEVEEYDYDSADFEADTIHLLTPTLWAAEEGDWVGVAPLGTEKQASVLLDFGEAITAKVPHHLKALLLDGIRSTDEQEPCTVALVEGRWTVQNVRGVDPALSSAGYEESVSGWRLDRELSQFANVQALGDVSSEVVNAETLSLGGEDLRTELLDPLAIGSWSFVEGANVTSTDQHTAETIVFQIDFGPVFANRHYLVAYRGVLANSASPSDYYSVRLRWTNSTTAGSAAAMPTLSSPVFPGSHVNVGNSNGNQRPSINNFVLWNPDADYVDVKAAMTIQRGSGTTGVAQIKNDDTDYQFQAFMLDMGTVGTIDATISQKSKVTGSPDPDPITTYTASFPFDEWRNYNGDESGWGWPSYLHQGYREAEHGNRRSLVGFFDGAAAIRSLLTGATVTKVTVKVRVAFTVENAGMDLRIRTHNHTSGLPTNWSAGSEIATRDNMRAGSTHSITLPTSYGTDLKNGAARGLGFGPGPDRGRRYSGYLYGPQSPTPLGSGPSGPVLTISYTK